MLDDSFIFNIPSFAKGDAYDFKGAAKNYAVFKELNAIAEEIEKCRAEKS